MEICKLKSVLMKGVSGRSLNIRLIPRGQRSKDDVYNNVHNNVETGIR